MSVYSDHGLMADKNATPMKRVSRACTFCRARKSRCDLEASGGAPPCGRCKKENRECVLGSSNRGGSRIRKKQIPTSAANGASHLPALLPVDEVTNQLSSGPNAQIQSIAGAHVQRQSSFGSAPATDNGYDVDDMSGPSSPEEQSIESSIPKNPSDAWQLLKDVAKEESNSRRQSPDYINGNGSLNHGTNEMRPPGANTTAYASITSYRLVREGYLTPEIIQNLVQTYFANYHCYLPLVPRKYTDPLNIDEFAVKDKHLLTAVLTIASKDLVDQPHIHGAISRYMHDLISGIAAGHDCEVEAVEALLLLAEWEPQGLRHNIEAVGRGEEDRSAWMHVGMALRTGYWLSIDRTAFRQESDEEAKMDSRKRFAWANCYVSDRLISVRIGRAFWCRGPGPMTGLSEKDFPTLLPQYDGDEDYATIFRATLDLTQLYSNVHDVLYSGMRSAGQMMLMGDYVKYVDDFRTAIDRWYRTWGQLKCSPHINVTLQLSYEYLRLYTNAFVFQAQISQAIAKKKKDTPLRDHLRNMFSNVGALPDARFIWGSVAAAKSYLTLLATQIDPIKHLRYMPTRYYLYAIYSAVFLFKARSYGVMQQPEEQNVRDLIYRAIDALRQASLSPQDPGSRYAQLLELLWLRSNKSSANSRFHMPSPTARSESQISSNGSIKYDAQGNMQYSPANNFSWLDLEAVGDYVSGDPMQSGSANILAPMGGYQAPAAFMSNADAMGWQPPGMMNNFQQFDLHGNYLF